MYSFVIETLFFFFLCCIVGGFCWLVYLFFCNLGLHLQHMEVPRLGDELDLQLPAYTQPQQYRIWALPVTYTTTLGNAGSLTHWARPGIKPISTWILVGFVTCWATKGTPFMLYCYLQCLHSSFGILICAFNYFSLSRATYSALLWFLQASGIP